MTGKTKGMLAGAAALLMAAIVCVILFFSRGGTAKATGGMSIQKDTVSWNETLPVRSEISQESIKMPYYGDITMRAGETSVGVTLVNPKENSCYFVYRIFLRDTGEEIYTSNLLEPGKAIDGIETNRAIKKGDYELDIKIYAYTMEDRQPLNNAVVNTKLIAV